ncbi:MAG: LPS-assembly protein LptD, partial [Alteraurantiacibacter sp.]|nr:LPS-assembly protein LptD [Alteraurantiacibacter sp.]
MQFPLPARRPLSLLPAALPVALLCAGAAGGVQPVMAQASATPLATPEEGRRIAFEADSLQYDDKTDTVTASGNVIARSGDESVRADAIVWNRQTGRITAEGNVR